MTRDDYATREISPAASGIGNIDVTKTSSHRVPGRGRRHYGDGEAAAQHRTKTVGYGVVLSGEIYPVLDDGERLLKPGPVVVQCGTNHAWSNCSDKPGRMAFLLIDGAAVGRGRALWPQALVVGLGLRVDLLDQRADELGDHSGPRDHEGGIHFRLERDFRRRDPRCASGLADLPIPPTVPRRRTHRRHRKVRKPG